MRSLVPIPLIAYWIAGLVAAFLFGWLVGSNPDRTRVSQSAEGSFRPPGSDDRNRITSLKRSRRSPDKGGSDSSVGVDPVAMDELVQPLSLDEMERYLRSGLASRDQTYRDLVISQVLSQLTAENAPTLVNAFKANKVHGGGENRNTLRKFVARWGEVDGSTAMLYAQMKDREEKAFVYSMDAKDLIAGVVEGWAKADSGACLSYLENLGMVEKNLLRYLAGAVATAQDREPFETYVAGLEDEKLRREAIGALGDGIKDNPAALLEWGDRALNMEDPDEDYVRRVLSQLARWLEAGPALAEWVDRNAASPLLSPIMFHEAANDWAKTDPRAALEWVTRNEANMGNPERCYDNVMEKWRTIDSPGHIEWISQNLDDPRVTSDRVNDAVAKWAETDPVGAADWVTRNSNGENIRNSAYTEVAERWVLRAPDEALVWAGTLPETAQRYAFLSAAKTWPQERLDEFASRLSSEAGAPGFDWARMVLARRYIDIDAEFALSLPGTIVDPEYRERSLSEVAKKVMKSDPAAVEGWLPGSGLSEEAQQNILSPES